MDSIRPARFGDYRTYRDGHNVPTGSELLGLKFAFPHCDLFLRDTRSWQLA